MMLVIAQLIALITAREAARNVEIIVAINQTLVFGHSEESQVIYKTINRPKYYQLHMKLMGWKEKDRQR